MDWSHHLEPGEVVRWEGRPAPRCWTFRNWRHSLFGAVLLAIAAWWQSMGFSLMAEYGWWVVVLPLPVVLLGLYLTVGHLLLARWQWESLFYAVTDRRVLTVGARAASLRLDELTWLRMEYHGAALASLLLTADDGRRVLQLRCLEHPETLLPLLEGAIRANTAQSPGEMI